MNDAVVIVALAPADAAEIVPLNAEVQSLHAARMPERFFAELDPQAMRDYFAGWLAKPDILGFGARAGGRLVGHAIFEAMNTSDRVFIRGERFGFLHHIVVAADFRRQGVGLALVDAGKAALRARGLTRLEASYWAFNTASARLMARAGLAIGEVIVEGEI